MKTHLAWILGGGVVLALSGMSVGACSSGDDTNTTDSGPKDSTVPDTSKSDTGPGTDSGNDASDAGMGADCKTPSGPFTTDSGAFCPYQVGSDGGTLFSACPNGDHCCVPKTGASTCSASACVFPDAGADFQCNETNDCPSNQVCCLVAPGHLAYDLGCQTLYDYVSYENGASCAATCPTGQPQICGSNADCTGGKTCFPVNTLGIWLGACLSADGGI